MIGGFFCAEEPLTYFHLTLELFGLPLAPKQKPTQSRPTLPSETLQMAKPSVQ
jgi:hypothetical protein